MYKTANIGDNYAEGVVSHEAEKGINLSLRFCEYVYYLQCMLLYELFTCAKRI